MLSEKWCNKCSYLEFTLYIEDIYCLDVKIKCPNFMRKCTCSQLLSISCFGLLSQDTKRWACGPLFFSKQRLRVRISLLSLLPCHLFHWAIITNSWVSHYPLCVLVILMSRGRGEQNKGLFAQKFHHYHAMVIGFLVRTTKGSIKSAFSWFLKDLVKALRPCMSIASMRMHCWVGEFQRKR